VPIVSVARAGNQLGFFPSRGGQRQGLPAACIDRDIQVDESRWPLKNSRVKRRVRGPLFSRWRRCPGVEHHRGRDGGAGAELGRNRRCRTGHSGKPWLCDPAAGERISWLWIRRCLLTRPPFWSLNLRDDIFLLQPSHKPGVLLVFAGQQSLDVAMPPQLATLFIDASSRHH
jgi:hypothetical protein